MKSVAVFVNEASTILLVIDPFHTVAVLESVAEDPAPHNRNRLLPHKVLSHLQLVIGIADIQFRLHVLNWLFKRGDGLTCEEQEREREGEYGTSTPMSFIAGCTGKFERKKEKKRKEKSNTKCRHSRQHPSEHAGLLPVGCCCCVCVCGGEERSLVYQCIFFFFTKQGMSVNPSRCWSGGAWCRRT